MRILVLWANDRSPNLGVRVLGAGTDALVRRVWPDAEVSFHNYGAKTAPVPIGSLRALAKETVTRRGGLADWFRGFDLVVDTRAGDSFASIYGLERHAAMSASAEYAHRCGVPVVLGPQTIGPFDSRISRAVARRSLRTSALVMARDSASADAAARLGRPVDVLTTDVVFALDVPEATTRRDVILNISGLLWQPNSHVDSTAYRAAVTGLYDALVGQGRTVSLLAHVLESSGADNDLPAVREFAQTLAAGAEILQPSSLTDVRQMLRGANLVIGSRMHACLNALSVGTPAIALAYSRKFAPLLGDLGWQHVVDLRTDPAEADRLALEIASRASLSEETAELGGRAAVLLERATDALRTRLGASVA
jgi:polysaccharide pyruvyl transferase WcaK-like protein